MTTENFHLVSHTLCPYVQRSVIVLIEKNISYKRTDIDLSNTPQWFKKISPMNRVPVLIVNQNKVLFESAVICEYINEITPDSLHPQDPLEKAFHRAWIEFGSGLLDSIGALYNAKDASEFETQRHDIKNKFQMIEQELNGSDFFMGDHFQMIDAVYATVFRYFDVFEKIVDLNIFETLPKVSTWRKALQQRDSVKQAALPEYPQLLLEFLKKRNSHISSLI